MAEKQPPAPSGTSTGAGAPEEPRPIARRPHPVIKPSTETVSLQPIGGGAPQAPGMPIGAAGPAAPAAPSSPPAAPTLSAPTTPLSPPSLGGIGSQAAPPPAASGATAAPAAAPKPGGLSAVGMAGGSSAPPDIHAALNTQPDAANPYLSSGRPDIDRRPVPATADDGSGFDTQKAVKIGIGVIVAVLAFFVVSAAMPSKIPVPNEFDTYNSASSAFSLEAPKGWARKGVDIQREDSMTGQKYEADSDGVTLTKGKGIIQVWTDTGGDVMQNQLLSGGGPNFAALVDDKHKQFMGVMKKRVGGFQETDAGSFTLAPFSAKVVEYTGTSGFLFFGGKVHGYAATVQGPKHFMQILLQCPENNWDDLKPVYERILKSAALDGVSAKTLQDRLGGFGGGAAGGGSIQIPGGGAVSLPQGVGGF
ncbi:MAG: hypothetical protein V4671_04550 [Armatimonadota bacterium]